MGLTYITTDNPAAQAAAKWLRSFIELPENTSIITDFEQEFECRVVYSDMFGSGKIYFANEQDLIWFLLKWS